MVLSPVMNLLNYPGLDRQRRYRYRWTTALAGGLAGVVLAAGGMHWTVSRLPPMQQELQRLQALVAAQKQQKKSLEHQQAQHATWQQQALHLQHVAEQHQAWQVLHQALLREAQGGALQWLSLELNQDRLALHGRAQSLPSMNQARQRLSHMLGIPLHISSALITPAKPEMHKPSGPDAGQQRLPAVEFVWHGDWPMTRTRSDKSGSLTKDAPAARPLP